MRPGSILLVEDDAGLREGLREYLELSGFFVMAAASGVECLNTVAQQRFAVAVIDLGLPDVSGQQLVEYLRRSTDTAVIVLTASNTLDTRIESYQHGAHLFLSKPIDVRELTAAISSLCARDRAPADAGHTGSTAHWQLIAASWTVMCPSGQAIRFTAKEFDFIFHLASAPGKSISREALCLAIYNRCDDTAQAALSTLVKRVRQRFAEALVEDQPVMTAHGMGYRWAGQASIRQHTETLRRPLS